MIRTKQHGRRTFAPVLPETHNAKRKRVWFSILNAVIVLVIVIILVLTVLAIL